MKMQSPQLIKYYYLQEVFKFINRKRFVQLFFNYSNHFQYFLYYLEVQFEFNINLIRFFTYPGSYAKFDH